MTESPALNKFVKWKRPLIGGFLSAGVATVSLLVLSLTKFDISISLLFLIWPMVFEYIFGIESKAWFKSLQIAILVWFLIGFGITYFIKSNKKAIGFWLLPFALSFLVAALIWFYFNFAAT